MLLALRSLFFVKPELAQRVVTITLGRDPEPPFCMDNPGGTIDISWNIEHTTTPRYVYYKLEDPTRTIILEQQTYPGNTRLNINRSWTVPNGVVDGKYWVHVEYWSFQPRKEGNAEVTFDVYAEAGDICTYKYKDANCNGELDPSDPPLSNWWVCIRTPGGNEICRETNGDGNVCFFGIPLGDYQVFEPPVDGWIPVGPDEYDVSLVGEEFIDVIFVNQQRYADCYGPCRLPDGHCEFVLAEICLANGGAPDGVGGDCDPNPCPLPPMACCFEDGHCEFVTAEVCTRLGGIPQGYGTDCEPSDCQQPPPTGACCLDDQGHCEVLTQARCEELGGDYQGDGVPWEPDNPCPIAPTQNTTWGAIKANYR